MVLSQPIFQSCYDKIIKTIFIATSAVREKCIKKAAAEEKNLSEEKEITDGITISIDESQRKKDFRLYM